MSGCELVAAGKAALSAYGYVKAAGEACEGNFARAGWSAAGGDVLNHVRDGVGTAYDAVGAAGDYQEHRHPTKADGSWDMRYARNKN